MKKLMRLCALLLCASLLLPLAACAGEGETDETRDSSVSAEEVTETDPFSTLDVPEVNYGGYEFIVLSADMKNYYTPLDVEEMNSEIVNDAIYTRNRTIEEKYGVRFKNDLKPWTELLSAMEKQVKAGGDSDYDLMMLICRDAYTATLSNYLYDYDRLTYVDADKDYYFTEINKQFSIGHRTFFAYSAESINVLSFTNCLLFNKAIADRHSMPDFYEMVKNNEWTMEQLFTYAEAGSMDLTGDGKLTLGSDVLGLIGDYDKINPAAWISAGESLITKDADDLPVFTASGNERFIDVMQDVLEHYSRDYCCAFTAGDNKADAFMNGRSVFFAQQVGSLITIRGMTDDYGLLPWPKYDLNQEHYYARAEDAWLHCVPTTCKDADRTSLILQALAYYSYHSVYDAYYKQALSAKYVRDAQSVEMLKQILSTSVVDLGDTIWYEKIRMPLVGTFCSSKGGTKLASTLKKYTKTAQSLIKEAMKFGEKQG